MTSDLQELFKPLRDAIRVKLNEALSDKNKDSRRLFHGRGKCYEGLEWLNADYLDDLLLVTVFSIPSEFEENTLMEALRAAILESVDSEQKQALRAVMIQRRDLDKAPFECLLGEVPEQAYARRKGLKFDLSFSQQNVGYFLDIEPVKQWIDENAEGKKVLNLFSYTCAFSVLACAAGASSVVNMDLSRRSLDRGRKNHLINELSTDAVKFFAHDIFKSWGKLRKYGAYDIVIIDPPSYQKGSFIATKDYGKVLAKMSDLVAPGGCFIACLNAPEITRQEFMSWVDERAEGFSLEKSLPVHADFPESETERGLKMCVYRKVLS